jgi:hypothetical protein
VEYWELLLVVMIAVAYMLDYIMYIYLQTCHVDVYVYIYISAIVLDVCLYTCAKTFDVFVHHSMYI